MFNLRIKIVDLHYPGKILWTVLFRLPLNLNLQLSRQNPLDVRRCPFTIQAIYSRAPDSAAETRAPACQFFLCFLDPPPPMCTGRGEGRGLPSA
jgi:hypothetical protein